MPNSILNPGGWNTLNNYVPPVIAPNPPGIVPQVYSGSTGAGTNQNVSTNNYGGYTPQVFQGGEMMPAYGTPAYNALISSGGGNSGGSYSAPALSSFVQMPQTKTISASNINTAATPIVLPTTTTGSYTQGGAIAGSVATGANPVTGIYDNLVTTETTPTTETVPKEKTSKEIMDEILGLQKTPASLAEDEAKARQQSGIDAALQQKNQTQSQINAITAQLNVDLLNQRKAISDAGGTTTGFGGVEAEISRLATIRLLPLQAQLATDSGNYQAASANYDRLFSIYSADSKAKTDQWNQAALAAYDLMTKTEQRKYEEKKAEKDSLTKTTDATIAYQRQLVRDATSAGDNITATAIASIRPPTAVAGTKLYAQQVADYNQQLSNYAGKITPKDKIDTPTIKSINGVDMQYNSATGKWETPTTETSSTAEKETTQKSIDQISFLRNTVKEATDLANASGVSGLSRKIGDWFVGDTKYRRLEAKTNTLRTNVLTLMTDPGVKKYFGPQMSEADVRLMTAAGTTLNPENNSPVDLKAELVRLDDLFNRMEVSLKQKTGSVMISPDGRSQVDISQLTPAQIEEAKKAGWK